jgi:hypothetical protein
MKRVKSRKNFRITNPIGFSLFLAGCLLALGVIAVIITLAVGYGGDVVKQVQDSIQGTVDEINDQPTFTPEVTAEPTETPEPILTPEVGTPAPSDTPTPEPIGDPNDTPEPTIDVTAPLYGKTVGLNPMRDRGAGYDAECAFNLEFSQNLAAYLESKGATVVLTRDSNDVSISAKQRGQIIKRAGCDIALEIVCNHLAAKSRGCYVRYSGAKTFAKELAAAYQSVTNIPYQSNHSSGIYSKTEDTIKNAGCPCVRLVLGNWENSTDRGIIEDEQMQQKIFEAIYNVLVGQLKGE